VDHGSRLRPALGDLRVRPARQSGAAARDVLPILRDRRGQTVARAASSLQSNPSSGRPTVADISVERKPRSPLGLILAIVLLAAIAGGVWWYMSRHNDRPAATAPAAPAAPPANP
jgi:hypothetical protein